MFRWLYYKLFYRPVMGMLRLPLRSSRWQTTRKYFLAKNPCCAACGCTEQLNVHHIKPFHLDPSKELDENNLITLCEKNNCHFLFGHLLSWKSYNPHVEKDAAIWRKKIDERP